ASREHPARARTPSREGGTARRGHPGLTLRPRFAGRRTASLCRQTRRVPLQFPRMSAVAADLPWTSEPDSGGHFGPYGGRYVPETLVHPLLELVAEYFRAQSDPDLQRELSYYLSQFVGRPTPLYPADRLTR